MTYQPADIWGDETYEKVSWKPRHEIKRPKTHQRQFFIHYEEEALSFASHRSTVVEVKEKRAYRCLHLLVLSIGFVIAGFIAALMVFSGVALSNGFPLSYVASMIVLIGAGIAFASEWRSRNSLR